MKASLRSTRISPKKASLIAKMVRGLPVNDALTSLQHTNKKAARLLEGLLESAIANAKTNENQDPGSLVVKTLVVNKAQAYHRGVPMARGRVRPMRKFLSHITLTLGVAADEAEKKQTSQRKQKSGNAQKGSEKASHTTKKPVQKTADSSDSKKGSKASVPKKTVSDSKVSAEKKSSVSSDSSDSSSSSK